MTGTKEFCDMHKMTMSNLFAAFSGESQAHMKYLIFAERARKEGFPNLARLFEAISYAEQVHATNHLRELGMVKGSRDNLQVAIDGETYEVEEMYPAFHAVAELQGEEGAERSTNYALEAEKIHAVLYGQAKAAVEQGQDSEAGPVQICEVCGHTVMGEAPERCPICGAPRSRFRTF
jgi:rubrerythrin